MKCARLQKKTFGRELTRMLLALLQNSQISLFDKRIWMWIEWLNIYFAFLKLKFLEAALVSLQSLDISPLTINSIYDYDKGVFVKIIF